jgi:V/A-type H+-transporting ATPase subunit K
MDTTTLIHFRELGAAAVLGLPAAGSALGAGVASMAAIGAWKKAFAQNKPTPFLLAAFVSAPLTQTFYGMVVMRTILEVAKQNVYLWWLGLFAGLAIGVSAWMQGTASAAACDAYGETGKGAAKYFIVIGIIESVAIFVLAFSLMAVGMITG